jgi:hypothetical protein
MKSEDKGNLIEEAISNIRADRSTTSTLLLNLIKSMNEQGATSHQTTGLIAAKYVETLQRSNEQLVKLASLLEKNKSTKVGLSLDEKQELFDMIGDEQGDDE